MRVEYIFRTVRPLELVMISPALDSKSLSISLSYWEYAEYVFCALVALACAGEFIADFTNVWTYGIKEKKDRLAKQSTLLLIVALTLELICLVKTNNIANLLTGSLSEKAEAADTKSQAAIDKSSVAEDKASQAGTNADRAQDAANTVAKQADSLDLRMQVATKKVGALELDVRSQGPRWSLISKATPALKKQLSAFPGQRAELFVCGRQGTADGETLSTWAAIANILEDGAGWKVGHGGLVFFPRCGGFQGTVVYVSKSAPKITMEAAKALGEGLARALPPSANKTPDIVDPDFSQKFMQPTEGSDTPWAMAANDPSLITVMIGSHPQQQ